MNTNLRFFSKVADSGTPPQRYRGRPCVSHNATINSSFTARAQRYCLSDKPWCLIKYETLGRISAILYLSFGVEIPSTVKSSISKSFSIMMITIWLAVTPSKNSCNTNASFIRSQHPVPAKPPLSVSPTTGRTKITVSSCSL